MAIQQAQPSHNMCIFHRPKKSNKRKHWLVFKASVRYVAYYKFQV